jgi:hypothetical protein
VVERGHLHVRLVVADAVREGRGAQQVEVGCIGQHRAVQFRCVADALVEAEPELLERRTLGRLERIARVDVAELERAFQRQPALDLVGQRGHHVGGHRVARLQVLGLGYLGHRQLVFGAVLAALERGRQEEDRPAVLDRGHAAHREAAAVAGAVDLVDDRGLDVAGHQEVGVQRMRGSRLVELVERRLGRGQRLAQDLAAEHVSGADVAALAAEQVDLEPFEREQLQQVGESLVHAGASGTGLRSRSHRAACA